MFIPYGYEQFHLELAGGKQKATFTGLRMPYITSTFPVFELAAAWADLQRAARLADHRDIPAVDDRVGGMCVDVIIDSNYLKHYPELV